MSQSGIAFSAGETSATGTLSVEVSIVLFSEESGVVFSDELFVEVSEPILVIQSGSSPVPEVFSDVYEKFCSSKCSLSGVSVHVEIVSGMLWDSSGVFVLGVDVVSSEAGACNQSGSQPSEVSEVLLELLAPAFVSIFTVSVAVVVFGIFSGATDVAAG